MKRAALLLLLAIIVLALNAQSASARLPYRNQFLATYEKSKIIDAAKEAKCNVCHYGKKKTSRNDYGTALSKHLNKDLYDELKKDKEGLAKKVEDALKAASEVKSVDGTTFAERIEKGELPGTAPEETEEE